MKTIKITDITIDGGTQQREKINTEMVDEYAEAMRCGAKFPPVKIFFDGVHHWLADGFHRYHACSAAEIPDISADVTPGTQRDALLYSTGANGAHGMRPTNSDKRKSVFVMLRDKEWSAWSDRAIAKHCKVTDPFVGKLRKELIPDKSEGVQTVSTAASNPKQDKASQTGNNCASEEAYDNTDHADLPKPKKSAPAKVEAPEPAPGSEYTELDALKDQVAELQDALAIAHDKDSTDEEKAHHADLVASLRKELKTANAMLAAITRSRDQLMVENAQLKRQVAMMQKQAKKAA